MAATSYDDAVQELAYHVMFMHPEEAPRGRCTLCDAEVPSDGPLDERLDILRLHVEERHPGALR